MLAGPPLLLELVEELEEPPEELLEPPEELLEPPEELLEPPEELLLEPLEEEVEEDALDDELPPVPAHANTAARAATVHTRFNMDDSLDMGWWPRGSVARMTTSRP